MYFPNAKGLCVLLLQMQANKSVSQTKFHVTQIWIWYYVKVLSVRCCFIFLLSLRLRNKIRLIRWNNTNDKWTITIYERWRELKTMISIEGSMHEISAKCRMELRVLNGSRAPWENEDEKKLIRCSKAKQQQQANNKKRTTTSATATIIAAPNKYTIAQCNNRVIANRNCRMLRIKSTRNWHCIVVAAAAAATGILHSIVSEPQL